MRSPSGNEFVATHWKYAEPDSCRRHRRTRLAVPHVELALKTFSSPIESGAGLPGSPRIEVEDGAGARVPRHLEDVLALAAGAVTRRGCGRDGDAGDDGHEGDGKGEHDTHAKTSSDESGPSPVKTSQRRLQFGFNTAREPVGSAWAHHVEVLFRVPGTLAAERDGRAIALGGARQRALLALLLSTPTRRSAPSGSSTSSGRADAAASRQAPAGGDHASAPGAECGRRRRAVGQRRRGYRSGRRPAGSTPSGSASSSPRAGTPSRTGSTSAPPARCARRSACGGARRTPTSPSSPRAAGDRTLHELRVAGSRIAWRPIWRSGATTRSCRHLERLVAEHPLRGADARAADARALPRRPSGRCAGELPGRRRLLVTELGLEPGPASGASSTTILAADPALDPPAPPAGACSTTSASRRRCSSPTCSGRQPTERDSELLRAARCEAAAAAARGGRGRRRMDRPRRGRRDRRRVRRACRARGPCGAGAGRGLAVRSDSPRRSVTR